MTAYARYAPCTQNALMTLKKASANGQLYAASTKSLTESARRRELFNLVRSSTEAQSHEIYRCIRANNCGSDIGALLYHIIYTIIDRNYLQQRQRRHSPFPQVGIRLSLPKLLQSSRLPLPWFGDSTMQQPHL
ncbi:hypothetical protein WHR41_09441 [Cladosporium halotolerans]|uniref:Uncharacterized protein n=1 Tax=Cladosporium halotolerans TaxID=1052096 RepID=A0AB34KCU5_9PEZI